MSTPRAACVGTLGLATGVLVAVSCVSSPPAPTLRPLLLSTESPNPESNRRTDAMPSSSQPVPLMVIATAPPESSQSLSPSSEQVLVSSTKPEEDHVPPAAWNAAKHFPVPCPDGGQVAQKLPYGPTFFFARWCERNMRKHGPFMSWYAGGQVQTQGQYRDGMEDGVWTHFYETGERKQENIYRAGKATGVWRSWYKSGRLEEAQPHADGKRHGKGVRWHGNGSVFTETVYVRGQVANGTHRFYDDRGRTIEAGPYVGGRRHGRWTTYDETGRPVRTTTYVRGEEVKGK